MKIRRIYKSTCCIIFILIQCSCATTFHHYNFGSPELIITKTLPPGNPILKDSLTSVKLVAYLLTDSIYPLDLRNLESTVKSNNGTLQVYEDSIVVLKDIDPILISQLENEINDFESTVRQKKYRSKKNSKNIFIVLLIIFLPPLLAIYFITKGIKDSIATANKEGCYIATACYGSYDAREVIIFRRFRDTVLRKSLFGRVFIQSYYFISPSVAIWLKGKKGTNNVVRRLFLDPLARVIDSHYS